MAIRFQRSVRLFAGVRLDINKRGLGVSAGVPGLRVGIDSRREAIHQRGQTANSLSAREYAKGSIGNAAAVGVLVAAGIIFGLLTVAMWR
jgi:hypothetical protein